MRTVGRAGHLYARRTLDYEDDTHRRGFKFMVQVTDSVGVRLRELVVISSEMEITILVTEVIVIMLTEMVMMINVIVMLIMKVLMKMNVISVMTMKMKMMMKIIIVFMMLVIIPVVMIEPINKVLTFFIDDISVIDNDTDIHYL